MTHFCFLLSQSPNPGFTIFFFLFFWMNNGEVAFGISWYFKDKIFSQWGWRNPSNPDY
jgi:hypothetical protein